MPTGYTAKLSEGPQSFQEFALGCARAFGALVSLRDDPMDAPIPDEFKPAEWNQKRLEEAKQRLAELKSMSDAEAEAAALEAWTVAKTAHLENLERVSAEGERYEAMARRVRDWDPPTKDHAGLKKFMLEQLDTGAPNTSYYEQNIPEKQSGTAWLSEQIARAARDVEYHRTEQEKEEERTKSRNAWVRALRESL